MSQNGLSIHLKFKSKLIRWVYSLYYKSMGVYAEHLIEGEEGYQKELNEGSIFKFMIYFGLGRRNKKRASQVNTILRNTYDNVECNWCGNVIEITAKGANKAKALNLLLEEKGINKDKLYVIGDSGNDISMFKAFPENSFCMGHAPETVKKYARYVVDKFEDLSRYIY